MNSLLHTLCTLLSLSVFCFSRQQLDNMHFLMPLIAATLGPRDVEKRVIGLGGKGRVVGDIWCSLNRLTRFTGCQGSTPDCRSGFFLIPWGYEGWEGEQARRTGPCACNEARVIKASNLIATSHHALATQRPLRARMHARTDTHRAGFAKGRCSQYASFATANSLPCRL